jgi:ribosomal protein S18 acetylase RimI-like enzyme
MTIDTRAVTASDAEATAALMTRIEADHPTGFCLSADEVRELLGTYPGVVFEGGWDGDDLVGFTTVLPRPVNDDGQFFLLFGDVDPARSGEGIGTLMAGRALAAARAIHEVDGPGTPARYATRALAGREDQAELLRSLGMRVDRHNFLMVTDLTEIPPARFPDDLSLAAFDPADGEELRRAHNVAFADYPHFTEADQQNWEGFMITASHCRPEQSFVLRDGDGAVASYLFVHEHAVPMSGGEGREAYVAYVGTVPQHRGRGLAGNLLAHTLDACRRAGYLRSSLDVDTENPTGALGMYERAGYGVLHRHDNYALAE